MQTGSTQCWSSAASDVYKGQALNVLYNEVANWVRANIDGEALISLLNSLPRIIGEVFSGVASQLGGIINIGKNIKSAVSANGTYRHKSELEAWILSGHPQQIVSSVHDQIRTTIKVLYHILV